MIIFVKNYWEEGGSVIQTQLLHKKAEILILINKLKRRIKTNEVLKMSDSDRSIPAYIRKEVRSRDGNRCRKCGLGRG